MYQALYRKYRPLTFDEVVGQDVIIRTLKNSIVNEKISHAYLFTGPRGTGKTTIAKILAKTINCEKKEELKPCNNCVSCTQINKHQSTDIVEIDAASNNGVDEIREIRNKVNLVPSVSKYKVYIIDEVHMLTTGAFNALLKTLEEPPSHIIFILATTEPHKIPATILSRCQRFDFKRISSNKLVERLNYICEQEKIEIDHQALVEISRISEGGMRDAISMLDQVLSYSDGKITLEDVHEVNGTLSQKDLGEFVESVFQNNIVDVLKLVDKYNDLGKNIVKLSEELIQLLKDILLFKTVPEYFNDKDQEKLYYSLGNNIEVEQLIDLIDQFNESLPKLKQSNDPKLILELLIIKYISTNKKEIINNKSIVVEENVELPVKKEEKNKVQVKENPKKEDIEITKSEINIKEQVKEEKDSSELHKKLEEIKQIRINNTLAAFNKPKFLELKKELDNIKDMLLNPDYSELVSTILDGALKAASDKNIIFVYDTNTLANYFNENLLVIEEILEHNYNKHFDVIAVDNISWEIIKKEFNSKSKQYVYQPETIDIKNLFITPKENDELNNLFGEIVEIVN